MVTNQRVSYIISFCKTEQFEISFFYKPLCLPAYFSACLSATSNNLIRIGLFVSSAEWHHSVECRSIMISNIQMYLSNIQIYYFFLLFRCFMIICRCLIKHSTQIFFCQSFYSLSFLYAAGWPKSLHFLLAAFLTGDIAATG